ncbi:MAG: HAD family hydrolase [Bacillota bacterium]
MGILDCSGDVGVSKPNTKIFEIACEISGKHPYEITYIGDDFKTDIVPSETLNMRGIWLNRRNERPEKPVERMIMTLNEIFKHIP